MPNPETFDGINPRGTETLIPCKDAAARSGIEAINGKIPSAASSDNKLVDTSAMNTAIGNKVDKVAGKGLSTNDYDNTAKGIVDTAQDNIIANTKLIKDTVGWSGKNKLQNFATNQTASGGGTVTVNADKSITLNGTFNERKDIYLEQDIASRLGNGNFKLSGCTGGSASTYRLQALTTNSSVVKSNDTEPVEFATSEFGGDINVRLVIYSGAVFSSPVTIYPMITDADIIDLTYEPYFGSTAFPRSEQAVLGAVNIAKPSSVASKTDNGVTFVNTDGVVVANNQATADAYMGWDIGHLPKGTYKLVGCPVGGSASAYCVRLGIGDIASDWGTYVNADYGDGFIFTVDNESKFYSIACRVFNGYTASDVTFKPMITPNLGATYADFAPHAMTNRELTDDITSMFLPVKMKSGYFEDWTTGTHDADTLSAGGVAEISNGNVANISHLPSGVSAACTLYTISPYANYYRQFCVMRDSIDIYVRIKQSGASYENWYKFGITQA